MWPGCRDRFCRWWPSIGPQHRYQVVITLGAVIRGDNPISMWWSRKPARALRRWRSTGVPVIFGVLTTDTMQQALERAGIKSNLGWSYGLEALEMGSLMAGFAPCCQLIGGSALQHHQLLRGCILKPELAIEPGTVCRHQIHPLDACNRLAMQEFFDHAPTLTVPLQITGHHDVPEHGAVETV